MKNGEIAGLSALKAPWRIGIDVGGTFTDLVLTDSGAVSHVVKVPSIPADPSQGVLAALERLARNLDCTVKDVLRDCVLFVHGSTIATNRMLEGKGAKVGLLTTEGFRDALEIRRGLREDQWHHRQPFAPVLVPRYLRRGVGGRIASDGSEYAPLVADDIDAALTAFEAERRGSGRDCALQQLPRRQARGRGCGTCTAAPRRRVDYDLGCTLADDGRVRTHVDGRRQCHARSGHRHIPAQPGRQAARAWPQPAAPAGAIQRRRHFGRPGRASARQPAAERTGRCCRRAQLLPPCDRRLGHCTGRRRQSHLDGDRRHLVRRHADVARRGGDEGRPDDRRLSRLDPVDRHPHHRSGRRNHCRRRFRWHALRRPAGGGRPSGAGVLWPRRHRADCHRRAARARPAASRRLCRLRSDSRPGRGPQGHREPHRPAARPVARGRGCRHHCDARAEPAARRRIYLHRARVCAAPVHFGGGGRRGPHARHQRRARARMSAGLRAPRCRRLVRDRHAARGRAAGFPDLHQGQAGRARAGPCRRRVGQVGRSGTCGAAVRGLCSRPGRSRARDRSALPRTALVASRAPDKGSVQPSQHPARLRGGVSAPLWSHSAGWRDHGCIVARRGPSCDGDTQGPTNRSKRPQGRGQAPRFPIGLAR